MLTPFIENKNLSFEEILNGIEELSYSQGFYGRLLNEINELDEESYETLKEKWDGAFADMLDFIISIEM
jgi:hypothetical protein